MYLNIVLPAAPKSPQIVFSLKVSSPNFGMYFSVLRAFLFAHPSSIQQSNSGSVNQTLDIFTR